MAKTKRNFPTGKFFLKYPKNCSNDTLYPIYIQYTWNRNVLKKTTEIKCRVCDWNGKGFNGRGELKSCYKGDYQRDNHFLQKMLTDMDAQMSLYAQQHPNSMSTDVVRDILQGKPLTRKDRGIDFIEYATDVVKSEYSLKKIGISVRKNYMSNLSMFSEFLVSKKKSNCGDRGIYIGDITKSLIDKFIVWRRDVKNNSDITINKTLTIISKTIKCAADDGLIDRSVANQIINTRIAIKPNLDDEDDLCEKYLTDEQIAQLMVYYKSCNEKRRREYLEMFFFAYYCGLRVVDVMSLRWTDIDFNKKELKKMLIKTSKRHVIPLIQPAIEVLNKWKDRHKVYVFGLLDDTFRLSDDEQLYKKRNNITQSINQSIKVVGENLGFDFPLTMHVARHSFAVYALNNKIDMSVVSRLLGHSSTVVTERVYAKFLPQTLSDEVGKLHFNSLF